MAHLSGVRRGSAAVALLFLFACSCTGSALHHAASDGDAGAVAEAIARGEDPRAPDEDFYTPLHLAAGMGHTSVVATLLSHGASPTDGDENGETALHLAAAVGREGAARELIAHGADVSQRSNLGCVLTRCTLAAPLPPCATLRPR